MNLIRCASCCAAETLPVLPVCFACIGYKLTVPCFKRQSLACRSSFFIFHRPRHPTHPRAKGFPPFCVFLRLWVGGGRLQPRLPRIGCVVRSSPFGIQTTRGILSFFALPCRGLSHVSPADNCRIRHIGKRHHTVVLSRTTRGQNTFCGHIQTAGLRCRCRGVDLQNKLTG